MVTPDYSMINVTSVTDLSTENVTNVSDGDDFDWDYWMSFFPKRVPVEDVFDKIYKYCQCITPWVGLLLNSLIVLVLAVRPKTKEQTVSILLSALAISDTFSLLQAMSNTVKTITSDEQSLTYYRWGCKGLQYIVNIARDCSSYIILTFTIDRLISVRYPLKKALWVTRKRVMAVLLCFPVIFSLMEWYVPYYLDVHTFPDKTFCKSAWPTRFFIASSVFRNTIGFVVPGVIVTVLNGLIIYHLGQWSKQRQSLTSGKQEGKAQDSSHSRSLTVLLVGVSTFSFVVSLPKVLITYINTVSLKTKGSFNMDPEYKIATQLADSLSLFNYCANFFFYCLSGSQFRNDLIRTPQRLLGLCFPRGKETKRAPPPVSAGLTKSTSGGLSRSSARSMSGSVASTVSGIAVTKASAEVL